VGLKELTSNLENFKYGTSSPDKIDGQIESGVDFFDDIEGGAIGFTPKVDLESRYHKYIEGTVVGPNAGVRANLKTRTAYGTFGEYGEEGNPGLSVPSHIYSGDDFGNPWSSDFPQFTSPFMDTPLANFVSQMSSNSLTLGTKNKQIRGDKTYNDRTYFITNQPAGDSFGSGAHIPNAHSLLDSLSKLSHNTHHLNRIPSISSPDWTTGVELGKHTQPQFTSPFMDTPLEDYESIHGLPSGPSLTLIVPEVVSSMDGGTVNVGNIPEKLFVGPPPATNRIAFGAHGYPFMVAPINTFESGYPRDPSQTWDNEDGTMTLLDSPFTPISYGKQRGVFDEHPNLNFDNNESSIDGGSIHISPGGQIEAGLRYGAMSGQDFVLHDQNVPLTDMVSALWETFPQHSNFMNPLALHNSRFVEPDGADWVIHDSYPISKTWTTDGNLIAAGNANGVKSGNPLTNIDRAGAQPLFFDSNRALALVYGVETKGGKQFIDNDKAIYGGKDYESVPSGLDGLTGLFGTKSFREVADPGHFHLFRQPFILREMGTQWGLDNIDSGGDGGFFGGAANLADNVMGGFVRGAPTFTGLISRTFTDKIRIGKFLLTGQGLTFLAKQFVLQGLNPTLESKIYNPLSAFSIVGASDLIDAFRGDGLSASSIGSSLISAFFPIGHPERHIGGGRYEDILLTTTQKGRLAWTAGAFSIQADVPELPRANTGIPFLNNFINDRVDDVTGGLDAAIHTPFFMLSNPNKYTFPASTAPKSVTKDGISFMGSADLALTDVGNAMTKPGGTFNKETSKMIANDIGLLKRHSTLAYDKLDSDFSYTKATSQTNIGQLNRRYFTATELNQAIIGQNSEILMEENIRRIDQSKAVRGIGEQGWPSAKGDDASARMERVDEDFGLIKGDPFGGAQTALGDNVDKINILPYGKGPKAIISGTEVKDFIKFRFADIVNNKYIVFRAILSGISDAITADYGEERYIGRPDKVYVYQGATRGINFNFKIYPKTKQELPVLMEKLNYLIGLCYPSYTAGQRMVTPFIQLTIGDMFNETPGLIESLNVTVEDSSTWEIEEGLQFPHYISVACQFKHIGKHHLSSKGKHYDLPWVADDQSWDHYPVRTKYKDMFEDLGQKVVAEKESVNTVFDSGGGGGTTGAGGF